MATLVSGRSFSVLSPCVDATIVAEEGNFWLCALLLLRLNLRHRAFLERPQSSCELTPTWFVSLEQKRLSFPTNMGCDCFRDARPSRLSVPAPFFAREAADMIRVDRLDSWTPVPFKDSMPEII